MAQICADTLGVDYRRVRVVLGQTDRIQYGIGAHASRASVMTGGATHAAALKVRAKALEMAAELLQAAPERHAGRQAVTLVGGYCDGLGIRQFFQIAP